MIFGRRNKKKDDALEQVIREAFKDVHIETLKADKISTDRITIATPFSNNNREVETKTCETVIKGILHPKWNRESVEVKIKESYETINELGASKVYYNVIEPLKLDIGYGTLEINGIYCPVYTSEDGKRLFEM